MRTITRGEPPSRRDDAADLAPIPLGTRGRRFLHPAEPATWEPVGAVARALDRLRQGSRRQQQAIQEEVRRGVHVQHVVERS